MPAGNGSISKRVPGILVVVLLLAAPVTAWRSSAGEVDPGCPTGASGTVPDPIGGPCPGVGDVAVAATPGSAGALSGASLAVGGSVPDRPPLCEGAAAACAAGRDALLSTDVVVWTSLNMGAGSGLDADLLAGYRAEDFLQRIAEEGATRAAADAALASQLALEASARARGDEALESRIARAEADLLGGLEAESAARGAEVRRLDGRVSAEVGEVRDALESESAARVAAVKAVEDALGSRTSRLEGFVNGGNFEGASATLSGDLLLGGALASGTVPWERLAGAPTLSPGPGLQGGGDLAASRTISLDLAGIAECTGADRKIVWAGPQGRLGCGADLDSTYSAGPGLVLVGSDFRIAPRGVGGGMIADAALSDVHVSAGAGIGWSKISKAGASLADLAVASAADLTSGTLADARLSGNVATLSGAQSFLGAKSFAADARFLENVSIGGARPGARLDVQGDVRWSGTLVEGAVPWARLGTFPPACASGEFVIALGPSPTCAEPRIPPPTSTSPGGVLVSTCAYGMVVTGVSPSGSLLCSFEEGWKWRKVPRADDVTPVEAGTRVGTHTSLALGDDGLPFVAFWDAGNAQYKALKCGNPACTAGNLISVIDEAGANPGSADVGQYPSAAIGFDGLPVIAYKDLLNRDLKVAKCSDPACRGPKTLTTVDAGGDVGSFPSIAIAPGGRPVIVHSSGDPYLRVVTCGNPACTSGNVATLLIVNGYPVPGKHASVAILRSGNLAVAFYHNMAPIYTGTPGIRYLTCGPPCVGDLGNVFWFGPVQAADGHHVSLTLSTDGLPVITYDGGMIRCHDETCYRSPATGGPGGRFSSVALATDGLPMVAYHDAGTKDLVFAKCSSPDCSSFSRAVVDQVGDVGAYASLSLGADRLPVISYYDASNDRLKVAHLGNELGVGSLWRRG